MLSRPEDEIKTGRQFDPEVVEAFRRVVASRIEQI